MRHRPRRPSRCTLHDRVVYASADHAADVVAGLYDLVPGARLAVYWCDEARAWHVTTSSYRAGAWRAS